MHEHLGRRHALQHHANRLVPHAGIVLAQRMDQRVPRAQRPGLADEVLQEEALLGLELEPLSDALPDHAEARLLLPDAAHRLLAQLDVERPERLRARGQVLEDHHLLRLPPAPLALERALHDPGVLEHELQQRLHLARRPLAELPAPLVERHLRGARVRVLAHPAVGQLARPRGPQPQGEAGRAPLALLAPRRSHGGLEAPGVCEGAAYAAAASRVGLHTEADLDHNRARGVLALPQRQHGRGGPLARFSLGLRGELGGGDRGLPAEGGLPDLPEVLLVHLEAEPSASLLAMVQDSSACVIPRRRHVAPPVRRRSGHLPRAPVGLNNLDHGEGIHLPENVEGAIELGGTNSHRQQLLALRRPWREAGRLLRPWRPQLRLAHRAAHCDRGLRASQCWPSGRGAL
mmetsp:Transcript_3896/g.10445  ORF Transcript_3896/g.10445 Transcript_3896/m.10445 type:complete len:403 (-) Transcript_3896:23-1231(-)